MQLSGEEKPVASKGGTRKLFLTKFWIGINGDHFHLLIAGCPLNEPAMSGLGVHFEEIEENVSSSEICDSINLALDAVLNWLQEAQGSQVNKLCPNY